MKLLSKLFGPPVKEWEREHSKRSPVSKIKEAPAEKIAEPDPEFEDDDDGPGFLSRVLGPSLKNWEQEYANRGVAPRFNDDTLDDADLLAAVPSGRLQQALRTIALENRAIPDIFPTKIKVPVPVGKPVLFNKKDPARRSMGRYEPAASMPQIDGAVTSAINAIGANSPDQIAEVVEAAQARLKGKTVDAKILNEKVRAKLG